jgi:hypothetical protein
VEVPTAAMRNEDQCVALFYFGFVFENLYMRAGSRPWAATDPARRPTQDGRPSRSITAERERDLVVTSLSLMDCLRYIAEQRTRADADGQAKAMPRGVGPNTCDDVSTARAPASLSSNALSIGDGKRKYACTSARCMQ